jgi:hypothetical protein
VAIARRGSRRETTDSFPAKNNSTNCAGFRALIFGQGKAAMKFRKSLAAWVAVTMVLLFAPALVLAGEGYADLVVAGLFGLLTLTLAGGIGYIAYQGRPIGRE